MILSINFIYESYIVLIFISSAQGNSSWLCCDFLEVREQVCEHLVAEVFAPVVLDGAQEVLVVHNIHQVGM